MRRGLHKFAIAITCLVSLLATAEASAIYDPGTGRFLQRDPSGTPEFNIAPRAGSFAARDAGRMYPDGMNLYAAYRVLRGGLDPSGLETCHIWVYLPENRRNAGDLFVYNHEGKVIFYTPVRGVGSHRNPLRTNGDTPTGDYVGTLEGPQKGSNPGDPPNDSFGEHDNIRLTGRSRYENQPAIDGEGAEAKRPGLLIHGGRRDRATDRKGSIYDVEKGEWVRGQEFKCPMGTHGCLRTYEPYQKELIDAMRGAMKKVDDEPCCTDWIVHIREQNAPKDPSTQPEWNDPRDKKGGGGDG